MIFNIILLFFIVHVVSATKEVSLKTPIGTFIGVEEGDSLVFKGIPYAKPPIEELRFKTPVAFHFQKANTYNTTVFGTKCAQHGFTLSDYSNEDCLYLNVWAPKDILEGKKNYPVMVFIHGGAWALGSGHDTYIDGKTLNEFGVILVTMNYRMGPFGFLTYPYITTERNGADGNLGLLDQRESFLWVHNYISHFGGDQNNVLIFGESAGAASIVFHLTSQNEDKEGKKLFHKAIILSTVDESLVGHDCTELEGASTLYMKQLGCYFEGELDKSVDCLHKKSDHEILAAIDPFFQNRQLFWHTHDNAGPCFDGTYFFSPSYHKISNKNWNYDIPLIIGNTLDEGTLFAFFTFPFIQINDEFYRNIIHDVFPNEFDRIMELYSPSKYGSPHLALSDLLSDLYFHCFSRAISNELVEHEDANVYRFVFRKISKAGNNKMGAYHSVELPYVFNTTAGGFFFPDKFTEDESALSELVIRYFTNFAKSGNPNYISRNFTSSDSPLWFPYSQNHSVLHFGDDLFHTTDFKDDVCNFWEEGYTAKLPSHHRPEILKHESTISRFLNANFFSILQNLKNLVIILALVLVFIVISIFWITRRRTNKNKPQHEKEVADKNKQIRKKKE